MTISVKIESAVFVEWIKRRLKKAYPDVKNGIRIEAMARALGFGSYNGMLARIDATEAFPITVTVSEAVFRGYLTSKGFEVAEDNQLSALLVRESADALPGAGEIYDVPHRGSETFYITRTVRSATVYDPVLIVDFDAIDKLCRCEVQDGTGFRMWIKSTHVYSDKTGTPVTIDPEWLAREKQRLSAMLKSLGHTGSTEAAE